MQCAHDIANGFEHRCKPALSTTLNMALGAAFFTTFSTALSFALGAHIFDGTMHFATYFFAALSFALGAHIFDGFAHIDHLLCVSVF